MLVPFCQVDFSQYQKNKAHLEYLALFPVSTPQLFFAHSKISAYFSAYFTMCEKQLGSGDWERSYRVPSVAKLVQGVQDIHADALSLPAGHNSESSEWFQKI